MAETALKLEPTSDLLDRFRRDGLVVVPGLFANNQRQEVLDDIVEVFALRARALGLRLPASSEQETFSALAAGLYGRDIPAYVAAARLTQHLASVHRMGLCPELMAVVRELGLELPAISTRPVIHYMADRLKIPGGYQKTPPHQDWRSVQGSLDGITIWTPLYDVGPNDYPLEVSPGSHLGGLMDATPDMPNYRVLPELYREPDFQPLELKAGDAVIFSGFLLHRTGETGAERVRVSLSFRFNNAAEPQFVRRNYPNPYVYRPDPAILTPDFPSAQELAAIFPEAGR
jgi:hypothetical protein